MRNCVESEYDTPAIEVERLVLKTYKYCHTYKVNVIDLQCSCHEAEYRAENCAAARQQTFFVATSGNRQTQIYKPRNTTAYFII
jgi:hypothetical protein